MELDKELLGKLIESHRNGGPPPSCLINTDDIFKVPEYLNICMFMSALHTSARLDDTDAVGIAAHTLSTVASTLQIGIELGLAYAELCRGVKQ